MTKKPVKTAKPKTAKPMKTARPMKVRAGWKVWHRKHRVNKEKVQRKARRDPKQMRLTNDGQLTQ